MLQARERQLREEQERLEREAAEAERKRKEEEEAQERATREAAEKEAALARMRQEKALSLGAEPEKGPNVTQVTCLILFIAFLMMLLSVIFYCLGLQDDYSIFCTTSIGTLCSLDLVS
jgi:Flp pilus assembly protein TadB